MMPRVRAFVFYLTIALTGQVAVTSMSTASELKPLATNPDPRRPIPDRGACEKGREWVREIYKEQFADHTSEGRRTLASLLLEQAERVQADEIGRYVLLDEARLLAMKCVDVETAVLAQAAIGDYFLIDVRKSILETLRALCSRVKRPDGPGAARVMLEMIDDCLARDDFEGGEELMMLSKPLWRLCARDDVVRDRCSSFARRIEGHRDFVLALERIQADPDDQDARLRAGVYLFFAREEHDAGVEHLARCSDPSLRAVATLERRFDGTPEFARMLGDAWYELGNSRGRGMRDAAYRRAIGYYRLAMEPVSELERLLLSARIQQMEGADGGAGAQDTPGADEPPVLEVQSSREVIKRHRGKIGAELLLEVVGTKKGMVWGTDIYTDDSDLGAAAVHMGLLAPGERGRVRVTLLPGQERYRGSDRNGVTSSTFERWGWSYKLEAAQGNGRGSSRGVRLPRPGQPS